jgi:uncharacterized protein RhaS with RHS repeats
MYDPTVGRFLTEDPSDFDGEDANTYRYVGNSPVNAVDPSGLAGYTGPGHWTFENEKALIDALNELFGRQLTNRELDVARQGCIGLTLLRIGKQNGAYPLNPLLYRAREAVFYIDKNAALTAYNNRQSNNDGKTWLLVAIQASVSLKDPTTRQIFSSGTTDPINIKDIKFDWTKGANYNWATWHSSGGNAYWEYMNTSWMEWTAEGHDHWFPTIFHKAELPKGWHTIYMIIEAK